MHDCHHESHGRMSFLIESFHMRRATQRAPHEQLCQSIKNGTALITGRRRQKTAEGPGLVDHIRSYMRIRINITSLASRERL